MKSRRSTATLTLVLIGTAGLAGCDGDTQTTARDIYRTRADCQRDWGDDPNKCEYQNSGSHSGGWYGPVYGYGSTRSAGGTTMPARSGSSAVGTTITRGGFGSSASAHASGG